MYGNIGVQEAQDILYSVYIVHMFNLVGVSSVR